jgi:putative copper resistance protein D
MLEAALTVSRFSHYLALLFIFGRALFPLYAFSGEERRVDPDSSRWNGKALFAACLVALASGAGWLIFASAIMTGSLSDALNAEMMRMILSETGFGIVWSVHLGLIVALVVLVRARQPLQCQPILVALLSAVCLASLAGVGHTQTQDGVDRLMHTAADGAHLLAAGAWLGGLVPLLSILTRHSRLVCHSDIDVTRILARFLEMGYFAVAVLLATGSINGWYLIGSVRQIPASLYGQLLLLKLAFFALMLLLAAMNRLWLVPALIASKSDQQKINILSRLRLHVVSEAILGLVIIALVSFLGSIAPEAGG